MAKRNESGEENLGNNTKIEGMTKDHETNEQPNDEVSGSLE